MKILFLISLLSFSIYASAQKRNFVLIDDIYSNWTKTYTDEKTACKTFFYSDIMDDQIIERVKDLFLEDSVFIKYNLKQDTTGAGRIIFDAKERDLIIQQLQHLNAQAWQDQIFKRSKLVPFNKIDSIQRSVNEKKLDPLVRLCYLVHIFSHPIFVRNNTICLFYFGETDFATKEGEFWIYKKEGSDWVKYSPLYRWVE